MELEQPPVDVAASDRAPLEIDLRGVIDEEISAVRQVLSDLESGTRARRLADYLMRVHPGTAFGDEFYERAKETPDPSRVPEEHAQRLHRLVRLMSLADDLASDDYRDPRLAVGPWFSVGG